MKKIIFIILFFMFMFSYGQVISYGETIIYHEFGHPDFTEMYGDTIVRTYFDGEEILYFIEGKVVRNISILSGKREARRELKAIQKWNKERNGWYWTGITKCRIIEKESQYILDCRKYDRNNPIPEPIKNQQL